MATRKVIRGDSDSFKVTFLAKTGICKNGKEQTVPINICGWDIRFTVRSSIPSTSTTSDNNAIIHKTAEILDAEKGIAYFVITNEDTNIEPGEYWYDIQYIRPANCHGEMKVKSLPKGRYIVISDITRDENYY